MKIHAFQIFWTTILLRSAHTCIYMKVSQILFWVRTKINIFLFEYHPEVWRLSSPYNFVDIPRQLPYTYTCTCTYMCYKTHMLHQSFPINLSSLTCWWLWMHPLFPEYTKRSLRHRWWLNEHTAPGHLQG